MEEKKQGETPRHWPRTRKERQALAAAGAKPESLTNRGKGKYRARFIAKLRAQAAAAAREQRAVDIAEGKKNPRPEPRGQPEQIASYYKDLISTEISAIRTRRYSAAADSVGAEGMQRQSSQAASARELAADIAAELKKRVQDPAGGLAAMETAELVEILAALERYAAFSAKASELLMLEQMAKEASTLERVVPRLFSMLARILGQMGRIKVGTGPLREALQAIARIEAAIRRQNAIDRRRLLLEHPQVDPGSPEGQKLVGPMDGRSMPAKSIRGGESWLGKLEEEASDESVAKELETSAAELSQALGAEGRVDEWLADLLSGESQPINPQEVTQFDAETPIPSESEGSL